MLLDDLSAGPYLLVAQLDPYPAKKVCQASSPSLNILGEDASRSDSAEKIDEQEDRQRHAEEPQKWQRDAAFKVFPGL